MHGDIKTCKIERSNLYRLIQFYQLFFLIKKMKSSNSLCTKSIKFIHQSQIRVFYISSSRKLKTPDEEYLFIDSQHPPQLFYLVPKVSEQGDCLQITMSPYSAHFYLPQNSDSAITSATVWCRRKLLTSICVLDMSGLYHHIWLAKTNK